MRIRHVRPASAEASDLVGIPRPGDPSRHTDGRSGTRHTPWRGRGETKTAACLLVAWLRRRRRLIDREDPPFACVIVNAASRDIVRALHRCRDRPPCLPSGAGEAFPARDASTGLLGREPAPRRVPRVRWSGRRPSHRWPSRGIQQNVCESGHGVRQLVRGGLRRPAAALGWDRRVDAHEFLLDRGLAPIGRDFRAEHFCSQGARHEAGGASGAAAHGRGAAAERGAGASPGCRAGRGSRGARVLHLVCAAGRRRRVRAPAARSRHLVPPGGVHGAGCAGRRAERRWSGDRRGKEGGEADAGAGGGGLSQSSKRARRGRPAPFPPGRWQLAAGDTRVGPGVLRGHGRDARYLRDAVDSGVHHHRRQGRGAHDRGGADAGQREWEPGRRRLQIRRARGGGRGHVGQAAAAAHGSSVEDEQWDE